MANTGIDEGRSTVGFSISDCPLETFLDFKEYADKHTGKTYWKALWMLMQQSKQNVLTEELLTRIVALELRIDELTALPEKEPVSPGVVTFGGKQE